ncbi:unnamed protein product [Meloidogyne enterolobii]|uniref:Uncharacterized protein n=1 Tax=Meloidogyne enterolobii TaxID=390850 RepID=A0ACB0Z3D0_MELEN
MCHQYLFTIVYFDTRQKTAQHTKLVSCETSTLAGHSSELWATNILPCHFTYTTDLSP